VLVRGLHKCPRQQDIGKKFDRSILASGSGLARLLRFIAGGTGVSSVGLKICRLYDLISTRGLPGGDVGEFIGSFDERRRLVNADDARQCGP